MTSAKDLRVAPISPQHSHRFVRANHYSGKSTNNSQLHLGAFLGRVLVGVAQFGPPMDRSKLIGLVRDTQWNGMLELNRLAMVDDTPKNSESRFLSVCMRLIRQHYPHVEWIVSFADATQCGDGTIYRAAGFVLTGIKKNTQIWQMPDGAVVVSSSLMAGDNGGSAIKARYGIPKEVDGRRVFTRMVATDARPPGRTSAVAGSASMAAFVEAGATPLPGFQLRYVYFLNPDARERLTVPVLPFSTITVMGAGMYRGKSRAGSIASDASAFQAEEGGATPTPALQASGDNDG